MTGFVRLTWRDRNWLEDRHIIYRSTSPIDIENLPEPIAELDPNVTEYVDNDVEEGETYFYRVGAGFRFSEAVSDQYELTALPTTDFRVYSGSHDATVQVVDPYGFMESYVDTPSHIYGVVVDVNGNVYASSTSTHRIRKYDANLNEIWQSDVPTGSCYKMDVDEDMNLFTTSSDNTIRKLDVDGNEVWEFTGHTSNSRDVFFDWIDNQLLSVGVDGRVFIIDPDTGIGELYTDGVNSGQSVTKDLDGCIVVGSSSGVRKFRWDEFGLMWHNSSIGTINHVVVDEYGYIYAASSDNFVVKLDRDNGTEMWRGDQFTGTVTSVKVDDSGFVYASSIDAQIIKYDGETGDEVWRYHGHVSNVDDIDITRFPYHLNRPGRVLYDRSLEEGFTYILPPSNLIVDAGFDIKERQEIKGIIL